MNNIENRNNIAKNKYKFKRWINKIEGNKNSLEE